MNQRVDPYSVLPPGFVPMGTAAPSPIPPPPPGFVPVSQAPKIAAPADVSKPGAFSRGFVTGLIEQNPSLTADTMEAMSHQAPERFRDILLSGAGELREVAKLRPEQYATRSQGLWNIEGIDDALTWAGEGLGQVISSTLPPLATGAAGAAAGGRIGGRIGAVAGGVGGAFAGSYALNTGEVYRSLIEEGVDPKTASDYSLITGGAMAALDQAFPASVIKRLGGLDKVRKEVARRVARRVAAEAAKGATTEGLTEAAQEALKEAAVASATEGEFFTVETGKKLIEAGALGTMGGAVMGGTTGIVPDRAGPPPGGDIPPPPPGFVPAAPQPTPPADDVAILRGAGYLDEQIADMSPPERAQAAQEAREAGVEIAAPIPPPPPGTAPMAPRMPAQAVADQPTAEPVSDIGAQIADLVDPVHERLGVWIPKDSVAHMSEAGGDTVLAAAITAGAVPVENFDGQGGLLLVKNQELADAVVEARDSGAPMQQILGVLTGAGEGKAADASAVVQQVTPEGSVTRETAVAPDQVPVAEQELQAPGHDVRTVAPEDALARREEMVAAEQPTIAQDELRANTGNVGNAGIPAPGTAPMAPRQPRPPMPGTAPMAPRRPTTEPAQNIPQNIPAPGAAPMAPRQPKAQDIPPPPPGFVPIATQPKEAPSAEEIRSYPRPVEEGGQVERPGQDVGGQDLQRPEGARPEAGHGQAQAPGPGPVAGPAAPAPEAETDNRQVTLTRQLKELLRDTAKPVTAKRLIVEAERAYGSTMAAGAFTRHDMHEALELAVNMMVRDDASLRVGDTGWQTPAQNLDKILTRLPAQRVRSEEQQAFQQFSTPPHYAMAAAYVANPRAGDIILEPSAGTGSLVAASIRPDVSFIVNELDPRRVALLREIVGDSGRVFTENAEQLDNVLPADVKPTLVVMNPPFSQTAGRMGDKKDIMVGAKHIEQALRRLEPGGRLVAIVGRGMTMGAPAFRAWWQKIGRDNAVRANIGVDGSVYAKYGTTFGTRLIVIDKVRDGSPPVTAEVQTVEDLMRILEPINEARPQVTAAEQQPAQPIRPGRPEEGEGVARPSTPPRPDAGAVGTGEARPGGVAGQGALRPGTAGAPDAGMAAGQLHGVAGQQPERPGGRGAGSVTGQRPETEDSKPGGRRGDRPRSDLQPDAEPASSAADRLELETAAPGSQAASSAITDSLYETYQPQRVRVKGAKPHPGPLVQSAAMASVEPPAPTYRPNIPVKIINDGMLSLAQLEAIIYAGQAHEGMLPAAEDKPAKRRGHFIGDGTGVGKGREIAGIILDNWRQGRTKAVWISEKKGLMQDARRDWSGIGQDQDVIFDLGKVKTGEPIKAGKGIAFTTYDTLKGGMSDQASIARGGFAKGEKVKIVAGVAEVSMDAGKVGTITGKAILRNRATFYPIQFADGTRIEVLAGHMERVGATATLKSRIDQLADWLGADFDGVIAFDEAHNMGNAVETKGARGKKEAAQKALAGIALQDRLPNARVLYVSATGATEVANLSYADRLGLWGRGTSFAGQGDFIRAIEGGGIAAMELVARDMKQLGLYTARNLSYDGVEYERVEHTLNQTQRGMYDTLAEAWQVVLANFNAAIEETDANSNARSAAMSAFWGAHQRFFNQIITSMQMPSVVKAVEKDLAEGRQAVLQLTNTSEAAQERAAAKATTAEDIEDLDITPRDGLIQLIEKSFPTQQYEQYIDENGNEKSRPVMDAEGNPVQNREAVRMREELIDRVASVRVPQGPLDMVLDHFGIDTVAEVTGRKRRFVMKPDPDTGAMRRAEDARPASANLGEAEAFQAGKKRILVFSQAGGTGRSYHADNQSASKGARRVHYLVQAGWRADTAVQGFGRTHRTNQASAPIFRLVTTDLKGQKRFISSIARRLAQLGALTKGQRQAGDQGVFSARDNLESAEARDALQTFYTDLVAGTIEGITVTAFEEQTGLTLMQRTPDGGTIGVKQDLPPVQQFLNRLLSLNIDLQNRVFDAFSDRIDAVIEQRQQAGLLDVGLETVRADKIEKVSEQTVHTIEEVGAETKHLRLKLSNRFKPLTFDKVRKNAKIDKWVKSPKGKVYAVTTALSKTDASSGHIIDQYRVYSPVSEQHLVPQDNIDRRDSKWEKLTEAEARGLWDEEVAAAPEFVTNDLHLITGAILPVWDRLGGSPRVVRLQTDAGERLIGRVVATSKIGQTLKALGADLEAAKIDVADVFPRLMEGARAKLTNEWTLKLALVAGERRIELVGPESYAEGDQVKADGVFTERIDYRVRYFVPTDPVEGPKVIAALTKFRPVVELEDSARKASLESRATAPASEPVFYSGLLRAVEGMSQPKAPPQQWAAMIQKAPGVKREELEWTGLLEWLGEQTGSVTREQVADFVRANQIEVKDVTKGGQVPQSAVDKVQMWFDINQAGREIDPGARLGEADAIADLEAAGVPGNLLQPFYDNINGGATKFSSYVLPGGENYRELLLTLPVKETTTDSVARELFDKPWRQLTSAEGDAVIAEMRKRGDDPKDMAFRTSHFEEPNILAHVRFNERTDADGKRVLFIEEIQSDWHQKGRKQGYKGKGDPSGTARKAYDDFVAALRDEAKTYYLGFVNKPEERALAEEMGEKLSQRESEDSIAKVLGKQIALRALWRDVQEAEQAASNTVPDAPFKTTWPELAFKRVLRYAVDNGFDRVAWTPGEVQAERYDLSKHIDRLDVFSARFVDTGGDGYQVDAYKDGEVRISKRVKREELPDLIGKEMADKVLKDIDTAKANRWGVKNMSSGNWSPRMASREEAEAYHERLPASVREQTVVLQMTPKNSAQYTGLDLKIGGKGMIGFYDRILPSTVNKLVKRWGGKVGTTEIATDEAREGPLGVKRGKFNRITAHSLDITDAMRGEVAKGQPLFNVLTRDQANAMREVAKIIAPELQETANRILGHGLVRVDVRPTLDREGRKWGEFDAHAGAIRIALGVADSAEGTLRHEIIHAMRENGLITKPEWSVLARRARAEWLEAYDIRGRYEFYRDTLDLSESQLEEILLEEAVADSYKHWKRAPESDTVTGRIFDKLARFIEAVSNLLSGHGYRTADDIFAGFDAGEAATRPVRAEGRGFDVLARDRSEGDLAALEDRGDRRPGPFEPPSMHWRDDMADHTQALLDRIPKAAGTAARTIRRKFQDRFIEVLRYQDAIAKHRGAPIPQYSDAYMAEELFPRRVGDKLEKLRDEKLRPIVERIRSHNLTLAEVDEFLAARHAPERNARIAEINPSMPDGGSGITTEEANAALDDFGRQGKIHKLEDAASLIDDLRRWTNNERLKSGLISKETFDSYDLYEHYVPLRGWESNPEAAEGSERPRIGRRFNVKGKEDRAALGRRSRSDSPLAYMILQAQEAIVRGEKNRVGQSLLRLVQQNPNPEIWEVNRKTRDRYLSDSTGLVAERMRVEDKADDVLAVKVGGIQNYITFKDPLLARAFKGDGIHPVPQVLHRLVRFYTMMRTARSPEFVFMTNFQRDIQAALINIQDAEIKGMTRGIIRDVGPAIKGIYKAERGNRTDTWAKHYREFSAAGGRISFYNIDDIASIKADMNRLMSLLTPNIWNKPREALLAIDDLLDKFNIAVENGVRLAVYINAKNAGVTKDKAASLAGNITTNFTRKGEWGPWINTAYPFYNAALQGVHRLGKALAHKKPRRIAIAIIAMGALMNMLNRFLADDDDEGRNQYDLIPEYIKERQFVLMIPAWLDEESAKKGRFIRFAMPWGYNFFHVVGDQMVDVMMGKEPTEALAQTMKALVGATNPISYGANFAQFITPSVFDPVVELSQNQNWLGRPIKPDNPFDKRPESQKAWSTVNPTLDRVTKWMNSATGGNELRPGWIDVSPETLEHWIEFAFGGAGAFVNRVYTGVEKLLGGEEVEIADIPFARITVGERSSWIDRGTYRDIVSEVQLVERELKLFRESGRRDEASETLREHRDLVRLIPMVKRSEGELRKLRAAQRVIDSAPGLSDDVRRSRRERLERRMDQVMKQVRVRYNQRADQ